MQKFYPFGAYANVKWSADIIADVTRPGKWPITRGAVGYIEAQRLADQLMRNGTHGGKREGSHPTLFTVRV